MLFSLHLPADGCVCQMLGADLAAAGWAAPVGIPRRAWLLLAGWWPVGTVRTMCSTSPCQLTISDPICVVVLLLCRLQACLHCIDGRGSPLCVRAGLDERGDGILGVEGAWRQRLRFGERCVAAARAVGGCWWRVGCAPLSVPADSRQVVENSGPRLLWGWAKRGCRARRAWRVGSCICVCDGLF